MDCPLQGFATALQKDGNFSLIGLSYKPLLMYSCCVLNTQRVLNRISAKSISGNKKRNVLKDFTNTSMESTGQDTQLMSLVG